MNGLLLSDVEFLGILKEWVRLRTFLEDNGSEGRRRRGTTGDLVTRMRVSVGVASDLVTYKALVVMHVLGTLGGGKSDCVHVHGVGVTVGGR